MAFALCLQIPNHIRFKQPIEIYANFIPQALFFLSIFGYLALCILYKWSVDWEAAGMTPPSLLNMIIAMFLSPGTIPPDARLYSGQAFVQVVLLGIAAICVPWLLITKPYIEWKEVQKTKAQGYVNLAHGDGERARHSADLGGEEEGNGRAIAEEMEEEAVSRSFPKLERMANLTYRRKSTTSPKSWFTKSFTQSNSASAAFPILLLTSVSGHCLSPTRNSLRSCGR